jgi:hypothetical protein
LTDKSMRHIFLMYLITQMGLTTFAQHVRVVNPLDSNLSIYPNEPSICIDRKNPHHMVIGANIDLHYFSQDFGNTWISDTFRSRYGMWGDPVLHASPSGRITLCHLSNTPGKKGYGKIDRIVVQYSEDGGASFDSGVFVGLNGNKMQDKPWLSEDEYSNTKYRGRMYLTWTEFDKIGSHMPWHRSRIRFAYKNLDSLSWSTAVTISDKQGNSVDNDGTMEGATTAVNAQGHVFCVWAGKNNLFFDKSLDGGLTWGEDQIIGEQEEGWTADVSHLSRANGLPFLVCDNSGDQFDGRLYVLYGDRKTDHHEVYLMSSDDKGNTWSEPIPVSSPATGDAYLGNLVVDQTTGRLYIVYYDRSSDEEGVFGHVILASSSDGGNNFTYTQLTHSPIAPGGESVFSGDYIDVDAYKGIVAAAWHRNKWASFIEARTLYSNQLTNTSALEADAVEVFAERLRKEIILHAVGKGQLEYQILPKRSKPIVDGGRKMVNVSGRERISLPAKKKDRLLIFEVLPNGDRKLISFL